MELHGKKIAILAEQLYQEVELWYPLYRFKEAGAEVIVVAPEAGKTYASKLGYPVKSDKAAAEVTAADFDALIVPGGFSPDYMRRNAAMVQLVKAITEQGKVVAAICHGPWMLCSADVLQGKRATSFFSIKADLVHAGAQWVDEEVVRDGNLITSRQPDDLPAFCREVIAALIQVPAGV
ncbi:MAG: type 1 glutamine amidotransferase [Chloroflexi bacterium]|uniref:Type 1 glutamine amidotransferase n=1 Tax=Candidatus Chlorohelix allophototropha TaxID=3003348 RepID=A0A8T7MAB2_9CHLR|nr:type 1 glutamine amidotransferase [Chloroflexota bacterium]WJW68997.1 type 1 glutamine amidotransferase [Chloroflexota bacterium L227-S17]